MYSWLPPVLTGKVPTTRNRFLLAGAVMFLAGLPAFPLLYLGVFLMYFCHVLALFALLLLCPRMWVAVLALLLATGLAWYGEVFPSTWHAVACLAPLWAGTLIGYRPRVGRR